MRVHPVATYAATRMYIIEQTRLRKDAHFEEPKKPDDPVPMEVDALLARIEALRGEQSPETEAEPDVDARRVA